VTPVASIYIDAGNTKTVASGNLQVRITDVSNTALNGVYYQYALNYTVNGYTIDGVTNGNISLIRGYTYSLQITANGHPFWIQSVSGGYSSSNIYSSGITNNGAETGTITFVVPNNAPNTLYYVCQLHSLMQGTINITDPWASDLTANTLDATYINNWLDVSGNCTIRGTSKNLITGTGDVSLNGTTTFTQQIIYNTDMSLNRRLIVGGDVSMSAGSFNVIRDVAINGILSVGSYKTGSISLSAINSGGGGASSGFTINATDTTFNIDMSYNAAVKINGDISLNQSETYSYLYTSPQIFKPTDATTTVAQKWQDIEISSTGQYQIAVVGGNRTNGSAAAEDVTGNVWISTNYGVTWTEKVVGGGVQCWISAMISGDGSIMMAKAKGNILYKSTDQGERTNIDQLIVLGPLYRCFHNPSKAPFR
jgi:hypothetical protein